MSLEPIEISIWHTACSNAPFLHHLWGQAVHWHNFYLNNCSLYMRMKYGLFQSLTHVLPFLGYMSYQIHSRAKRCEWLKCVWNYIFRMTGSLRSKWVNSLRPRPNRRYFADDIFKRIFFNENVWISIKISLKFVPKGPINNIPALVQIMAWRRSGDKPLSEPMMVGLSTHICVTRPQWVKLRITKRLITLASPKELM